MPRITDASILYGIAIGDVVGELRFINDMSQSDVARAVDHPALTQPQVSRIENECRIPSAQTLHLLCEAFDITPNEMFERIEESMRKHAKEGPPRWLSAFRMKSTSPWKMSSSARSSSTTGVR